MTGRGPAGSSGDGAVSLRRPGPDDLDELVGAVRRSLADLGPWMPWATAGYDRAAAAWFLDEIDAGREDAYLIVDHAGRVVGACGTNRHDALNRSVNLGYWRATGAGGRGFVTRAARAVAIRAFTRRSAERIEIVMATTNTPSRRVAERLGALREGRLRRALRLDGRQVDAYLYALLRDDLPRLRREARGDEGHPGHEA